MTIPVLSDLATWPTLIAAIPAGIGGALLGAKAIDWVRDHFDRGGREGAPARRRID